jgi:hypothetical protein
MPRLSSDLAGFIGPKECQGCGAGANLTRWRECDDQDIPENIIVVLCKPCAMLLIEQHPRLYLALDQWEPWPGSMTVCDDCTHRQGTRCAHPAAKANGGAGVILTMPRPSQVHLYFGGGKQSHKNGCRTLFQGPVSACKQKEVAHAAGTAPYQS